MMRPSLIVALAVIPLAACASTPPSAARGPVLAGVDLSRPLAVLGTEPFWDVALSDDMRFTSTEEPEQRAPRPRPERVGETVVFRSRVSDGRALVLTLSPEECSDGMSDRTFPLAAVVQLGDAAFRGCAATKSALERAGETGLVVD